MAAEDDGVARTVGLGMFAPLAVVGAVGLAIVSLADGLSRTGRAGAALLFWVGLSVIVIPTFARLVHPGTGPGERVALLVLLGLTLYVVKVMRDPFAFTYADELVHQHNVDAILASRDLFRANPILKVTPSYPGLEVVTASIVAMTGLSAFTAGLLVIGVARIVIVLALFLLFERMTGSPRLAGIAAAMYFATPTFLFFGAQFSYESLALPIALYAALAGVRSFHTAGAASRAWYRLAVVSVVTVAMVHHMTSYALVAFFVATAVAAVVWRLPVKPRLMLAGSALLVTAGWLVVVAKNTIGYLSPVLSRAIAATAQTASREAAPRTPFRSSSGVSAPPWERLVALASAVVVVAAQPAGVLRFWWRQRDRAVATVLAAASLAYVGSLGLRLVPAAWETGVRSSEFLFVGGAVVIACAVATGKLAARVGHVAVPAVAVVLFAGGVISGSTSALRTAQPYRVEVGGGSMEPPATTAALWARTSLPGTTPVAAHEADARLFLVHGERDVRTGTNPPIKSVLISPVLYRWHVDLLRRERVRFVVVDRRVAAANVTTGYFFPSAAVGDDRFPDQAVAKFERAGADRVFDSGVVFIDDVTTLRRASARP